jgi:hypothetical protein
MKNILFFVACVSALLIPSCKKHEHPDPFKTIGDDITNGSWKISQLLIDDIDNTGQFLQHRLSFSFDKTEIAQGYFFNTIILSNGIDSTPGTWIFIHPGPEENFKALIAINVVNELHPLSAAWGVDSHTKGQLRLVKPVREFSADVRTMVLDKVK